MADELDKLINKDSFLNKQEKRPYTVKMDKHVDIYSPEAVLRKWNPPDQNYAYQRATQKKPSELLMEKKTNEKGKQRYV